MRFWEALGANERGKGWRGATPEYRQPPRMERQLTEGGACFDTPGGGAVEGGGVTSPKVRGTKTGNKVLSLWKGGK
nr:MAG TPA: hypothetical protein [Caudoviricetes sp.]